MARCRKTLGASGPTLELCEPAKYAVKLGLVVKQAMSDFKVNRHRDRLAIKKGRDSAPLHFCPWCGADIDTRVDATGAPT